MSKWLVNILLVALVVAMGFYVRAQKQSIRVEYCRQLESLKAQNREDVAESKRNYQRNLRLLKLKDSPELRKAAEENWARKLARNAPKSCPYTA